MNWKAFFGFIGLFLIAMLYAAIGTWAAITFGEWTLSITIGLMVLAGAIIVGRAGR